MKPILSTLIVSILFLASPNTRAIVIFQGGEPHIAAPTAKAGEHMERSLSAFHEMLVGIEMKNRDQVGKARGDAIKSAEAALANYRAAAEKANAEKKLNIPFSPEDKKRVDRLKFLLPNKTIPSTEKELAQVAVVEVEKFLRELQDFNPKGNADDFDKAFAISKTKWRLEELGFLCSLVWQSNTPK